MEGRREEEREEERKKGRGKRGRIKQWGKGRKKEGKKGRNTELQRFFMNLYANFINEIIVSTWKYIKLITYYVQVWFIQEM